ncbi:MAG TPA: 16S rRNA (guanine(527)-N(7))-methyltransferase RsmG [Bryobacteraceae bacterium]|jgi:16S rRNA (guanine527-N7)-methyltransferase
MTFQELVASEFKPFGVLNPHQLSLLERHFQLLLTWNQRLNLTRITELEEAVRFHYCESLYLGLKLPAGPVRVVDLGSGPGFPGIPVAILRPDLHMTLVESNQRKAVFLREAARELPNVAVSAVRIQDCRERFDWVVARAVTPKEVLDSGLAPNFALLINPLDAPAGAEVTKSPWGRDRATSVSRETLAT